MTIALKDGGGPDSNLHHVVVRMKKGDNVTFDEEIAILSTGIGPI